MNIDERCPECGGRLKAGAQEDLCARCLLVAALRHSPADASEDLLEPGRRIAGIANSSNATVWPNRERNNSTMPLCQPKRPKGTKSRIWWLDFHSDGQCIRRIHCAAPNSEDRVQPGDERTPPLAAPHWPTSCRWHPLRNNEAPRSQRARQEPNGFQWCRDPSGRGRRNLTLAEMTSGSAPATTKSRFGDSAVLRRLRRAARIPRR